MERVKKESFACIKIKDLDFYTEKKLDFLAEL